MGPVMQSTGPVMATASSPGKRSSVRLGQELPPDSAERQRAIRLGTSHPQRRAKDQEPQPHDQRLDVDSSDKANGNARSQTTEFQPMGP